MRTRALLVLLVCLSFACKRVDGPESVSDQSDIPVPPPIEPPLTIERCYAGTAVYGTSEAELAGVPKCEPAAEGCLDPQPVVVRREATPEYSTLVEEWVDGPTESTHPTTSTLGMTVNGSRVTFTVSSQVNPLGPESERKQLTWSGEGELSGEPWHWTAWTLKQTRQPPLTDVIRARIDGDTLRRDTMITRENGSLVLLRRDTLREFSCDEWYDRREATLSAPIPP